MGLAKHVSQAMAAQRHRRAHPPGAPVGRVQAQDVGSEQAVAGVHGAVQSAELRGRHCAGCGGG